MFPFLATPWALLGLLSLPALAAIYWLRNRFRRVPVSSLMLWADQQEARQGGLRLDRLQTPLLFFLELLALTLLAVAAAGPFAATGREPTSLVVVLDDSYSMRAGGEESPRSLAIAALREELESGEPYEVRFVLAGDAPQALGEPRRPAGEVLALLDDWRCRAAAADLEKAVGFAGELAGPRALILVLTDHPPATTPDRGRVRWWAFGNPRSNLAFVSAVRSGQDGRERCLLEVANFSPQPHTASLLVEAEGIGVLHRATLPLAAQETSRVVLKVKAGTPTLTARLEDDELDIDNHVTVLSQERRPVRTEVRIKDESLRPHVEKALEATANVKLGPGPSDLLLTDQEEVQPDGPDAWVVRLLVEKDAEAYVGPFILDRTHPLTEGLSLRGVVWAAGKGLGLPGMPVVLAGKVPLLSDAEGATGRHDLRLRLRPDLSTLQDRPAWPTLLKNLIDWRQAEAPGLARSNLRLGEAAVLTVPAGVETVEVLGPDGARRVVPVHGRRAIIRAEDVGHYQTHTSAGRHDFAVNALSRQESDLGACATGRWGEWVQTSAPGLEARGLAWLLLLLVLAVLTAHVALVARAGRRRAHVYSRPTPHAARPTMAGRLA
jgi:hypothetical protein